MDRRDRIAFKLTLDQIKTKEDFLEFLSLSVKNIYFIIDNESITASNKKQDLDVTFLKLKDKINDWISESSHSEPFYPRDFIKKILKHGTHFNFIDRKDDKNKMNPSDYRIYNSKDIKNFLLQRIGTDDQKNGLKFKHNSMNLSEGMPLDVYNAIVFNYKLKKFTRIYIKFMINKELDEVYFNINFISMHDDKEQI